MKNFRIHSTVNHGIHSQNLTTTVRAKDEAAAREQAKRILEGQGHTVVAQWRGR